MLSCRDVMAILSVSKSLAYKIMDSIPHMDRPLRVRERDLRVYVEDRMIYPMPKQKRRKGA